MEEHVPKTIRGTIMPPHVEAIVDVTYIWRRAAAIIHRRIYYPARPHRIIDNKLSQLIAGKRKLLTQPLFGGYTIGAIIITRSQDT